MLPQPDLIVHADWSLRAARRRQCAARLIAGGYRLMPPEPVGPLEDWLDRLQAGGRTVLLGLDLPIGLPAAYARAAGVDDFAHLLARLGAGEWVAFYDVAATPEEISFRRPFYPARPGNARLRHLLDGLGLADAGDLRRACDRATPGRRAAAPLFWTMGAQQAGKAAISGWRDLLAPALRAGRDLALWPFDGPLAELLARRPLVVAESYPAEFYHHLGVVFPARAGGKRSQAARAANAGTLLAWAAANGVALHPALEADAGDGFGPAADAEDRFDAVVGAMGMLNVVLGNRPPGEPADPVTRRVEGWILGQLVEGSPGSPS
jgi:hypothetical protein